MTLILSAAVYVTMVVAGTDGKVRAGLAQAEARPAVETYRYIPVPQQVAAVQAPATVLPTAVVTAAALNLRAGPSTGSEALDKLSHGEEVTVVSTKGQWTQIRLEGSGGEGWVASEYLAEMPVRMAGN
ncbi:SH3 domain-containing protein [Falsirhodobacter sp. 20TX0035]|uniref:SH3 domain-containing protein n=1 Tax=Falsirhodobacter sp. 20TX0035 TaxID=3022019 RepID=UPI0023303E09|nr:SH3 domain-containing protein [Falsirhodobacter sp. 20TX0035]MDB6454609.1 SH3 domain-containing protein [Falsirhodobacter sp. 20TX0035]